MAIPLSDTTKAVLDLMRDGKERTSAEVAELLKRPDWRRKRIMNAVVYLGNLGRLTMTRNGRKTTYRMDSVSAEDAPFLLARCWTAAGERVEYGA